MSYTSGYVRLPPDSTGKKGRTRYKTIGADEVHEEITQTQDVLNNQADMRFWRHCAQFVERWGFLSDTDTRLRDENFYGIYRGRTRSIWMTEEAKVDPYTWTAIPSDMILEANNTQQPDAWGNAIKLRNSIDGEAFNELYIAPKIWQKPPIVFYFDAYIPTINDTNFPEKSYIAIGAEECSGGYRGDLFDLEILYGEGESLICRLHAVGTGDGGIWKETNIIGLEASIPQGAWKDFKLVLTDRYLELFASLTPIARMYHQMSGICGAVNPFFANESRTPLINDVIRIGQFQSFEMLPSRDVLELIDDASLEASGTVDSSLYVFPRKCAVTVKGTYHADATKGMRVYVLASPDAGNSYDSATLDDAFAIFEPSFTAGATRQRTINLDSLPKYGKFRVENLDSGQAITNVLLHVQEDDTP